MIRRSTRSVEYKNSLLLTDREDFKALVHTLRKKYGIPTWGFKDRKTLEQWRLKLTSVKNLIPSKHSYFLGEINQYVLQQNLALHWTHFIVTYIEQNKREKIFQLRSGNHPYLPRYRIITLYKRQFIQLLLDANTTQKDVTSIWKDVVRLQKKMPGYGRSRVRKALQRDRKTARMLEKEKHGNEIYNEISDKRMRKANTRGKDKTIDPNSILRGGYRLQKDLKKRQ